MMKNGKISKKERACEMYLAGVTVDAAIKDIVAAKGYVNTLYTQWGKPPKEEYKNKWIELFDKLEIDESKTISCETIEDCEKMKIVINTSIRRYTKKKYTTRILFIKKQILITRDL